ncbi:MAG: glutamine amidotransferase-related protein, partial [Deltaproteobacteria bacterium]
EEQRRLDKVGGSMRLGSYSCDLKPGSHAAKIYGKTKITERHRHRYEVNNHYRKALEDGGITFSGMNPDTGLVEMMELTQHPWFITCQFHPEFKSKPFLPHPLFVGFVKAALQQSLNQKKDSKARLLSTKKKTTRSELRFSARN